MGTVKLEIDDLDFQEIISALSTKADLVKPTNRTRYTEIWTIINELSYQYSTQEKK